MRVSPSLTSGPVGRRLVSLTIPMMMGIMSLMVFNLVDTFFLGRLSLEALSAISFTFPVVMIGRQHDNRRGRKKYSDHHDT